MTEEILRRTLTEKVPAIADGRIEVISAGFERFRAYVVVRAVEPGIDAVAVVVEHLRGDAIDVIPFTAPPDPNER